MEISGTTWLVTGASAGIGESVARAAVLRGARVIGIARRRDLLEGVMESIGGVAVVADLGDPDALNGLIERVEGDHGAIDVLVNNAGVEMVGPFLEATADEVRAIHQLNLMTPIELCRQILPLMQERGRGHVVNVSSMASSAGFSGMSLYGSTKAGLSNFHRIVRSELKKSPVGLTIVEVGPIPSDMLDRVYAHPPAERGFRRMRRLQLMPEISREVIAESIVDAVEHARHAVRYPKRASIFPWMTSAPQRIVDLLTVGRSRTS